MKKIISVFAAAAVIIGNAFCLNAAEIDVSAQSAILMDAQTGKVLFAKNEHTKRPMASTTKIMTTLLCLESGNLDEKFVVDASAIMVEGSSMGLQEGDVVTKRALCYGMMLPSGNDAANATAIKLAGNYEDFAEMMNGRAKQIGMTSTHFVTPSGLDGTGHGSTAYDMALLTREALKNPDFQEICSQKSAKLSFGNPPFDRWLKNSNKLLSMYDGCIGVKTGFTDDAGRCLVSAASRNGVTLICVTLKAPSDWEDHRKMLDYGFSVEQCYDLPYPESVSEITVAGGEADSIRLAVSEKPVASLVSGELSRVSVRTVIPPFLYAPVAVNSQVGRTEYYLDGILIETVPIVATESCSEVKYEPKRGFIEEIKQFLAKKLDK